MSPFSYSPELLSDTTGGNLVLGGLEGQGVHRLGHDLQTLLLRILQKPLPVLGGNLRHVVPLDAQPIAPEDFHPLDLQIGQVRILVLFIRQFQEPPHVIAVDVDVLLLVQQRLKGIPWSVEGGKLSPVGGAFGLTTVLPFFPLPRHAEGDCLLHPGLVADRDALHHEGTPHRQVRIAGGDVRFTVRQCAVGFVNREGLLLEVRVVANLLFDGP